MFQTILFTLLVTAANAAWSSTVLDLLKKYEPTATFTTAKPLVPFTGYSFSYALDSAKKHITFAVEADTTGWIGLGIAEAAGMKGADIMMGHVDSAGKAVVGDYHSVSNGKPTRDGCQDWTAHYGEESDGKTLLVFSRKLSTGDSNDHALFTNTIKRQTLILAYGANGDDVPANYAYHAGSKRAKFSFDINKAEKVSHATWTAAKIAKTDLTYIDLRADGMANSCTNCAASKEISNGKNYAGPTAGGYVVPTEMTTYTEFCYPLSENSVLFGDRSTHMIAFEGLVDPEGRTSSPNNIHHTVLHAYPGDDCTQAGAVIWVGGVTFYEDLPTDVGIKFSRYKSLRVQTHYDNPAKTAGLKDNSGVRVYLQTTAPLHDAGTLQLGDGTIELSRTDGTGANSQKAVIPQGRSFWTFGCPATFTNAWPIEKVTVFGSILHMHKMGDMMYTEVTHADGTPAKRVNSVQYFDFDHQDPTLIVPYEIKKGDSLKTRCYFNNKNPASKPLHFGLGSDEEMCIDFLYYYPYNADIKDHCTMPTGAASYSGHFGGTYDGTQTITDVSDAGMRVFGVSVGTEDAATCTGGATVEWKNPNLSPKDPPTSPSPQSKGDNDKIDSNSPSSESEETSAGERSHVTLAAVGVMAVAGLVFA